MTKFCHLDSILERFKMLASFYSWGRFAFWPAASFPLLMQLITSEKIRFDYPEIIPNYLFDNMNLPVL